jgi:predicted aldo/keto reductase-like oxidoreductase
LVANLHDYLAGQCVYCQHCLPCPQGIEVGWVLWYVDQARGGVSDDLRSGYAGFPVKASACVECGECVERCPFDVNILARLRQAVEIFEAG